MKLRRLAIVLAVFATGGCVDSFKAKRPISQPEFYVKNVKGYAETATGLPPEESLGWDLTVAGGTARWNECAAVDDCRAIQRERPAADLLGFERIDETVVDGRRVDVLKLSLAPRPKYIVPSFKP